MQPPVFNTRRPTNRFGRAMGYLLTAAFTATILLALVAVSAVLIRWAF